MDRHAKLDKTLIYTKMGDAARTASAKRYTYLAAHVFPTYLSDLPNGL
jgi:hypothetical protein